MFTGLFSPASNSFRTTVIFLVENLLFDARVHHAVGFQFQRPAEILIGGIHRSK